MKIAVIKGSPHKNGSSNLLADQFAAGAREAGHDVLEFDAAHMNIHPCLGCGHCGMDGPCAQKDDMARITEALLSADMAVFVTPLYYFGMSAQLKTVIDRFYSHTVKLSSRHIKTALIAAAWDSGGDVMTCLLEHYKKLCRYMNFTECGMILGEGCGTPSITRNSPYMREAYELGKSLQRS